MKIQKYEVKGQKEEIKEQRLNKLIELINMEESQE
jgi:hypothetical protein